MSVHIPGLLEEAQKHGLLQEVLEHAGYLILNSPREKDKINFAIQEAFDEWIK